MEHAAIELLKVIKSGLSSGIDAIQGQFPVLCKQILQWGIITNIWQGMLYILAVCVSLYFVGYPIKKMMENPNEDYSFSPGYIIQTVLFYILISVFVIAFMICVSNILKIVYAPNLYLVEYFKSLTVK